MDYQFESLGPTLRLISLVFLLVGALAALGLLVLLAALPGRIALARSHPQAMAVNTLGWLGLPTGILWILAMTWSFWRYDCQPGGEESQISDLNLLAGRLDQLENSIAVLEKYEARQQS